MLRLYEWAIDIFEGPPLRGCRVRGLPALLVTGSAEGNAMVPAFARVALARLPILGRLLGLGVPPLVPLGLGLCRECDCEVGSADFRGNGGGVKIDFPVRFGLPIVAFL